ncbi:MFS transporter permease [Limnochorda pilosa]|uniref:MFS transporter permease n=1 Tax=Limnochorda pilosa TaxID=1555112 RepID=A0A0K2SNP1_LIMPI|nr:MFS transporter permease [Limnochorda pilosa]
MSTATQPAGLPERWRILAAINLGTLMAPLDGSVVNIALPTLTHAFGVPLVTSEWVAMIYLLLVSTLLLTYGRLGDLYGHRPVYLSGFGVFSLGSLLCAAAPTMGALIGARAVQALGAGMMMAAGPAIITAAFPSQERGRALGLNGMVVAAGLALGPVLGGYLVTRFGWRSIFLINLPIGAAGIFWAGRVIPRLPTRPGTGAFDVPGAALAGLGLGALLLALSRGEVWGWGSGAVLLLGFVGIASLGLFVAVERRRRDPMVDVALFRNRVFASSSASALLNFMAQFSVTFLMPFFLQDVQGRTAQEAGLLMLAFPLMFLPLAPLAGWLSDRWGTRELAAAGMAVLALAGWTLSRLVPESGAASIVWRLALVGVGAGLFQPPNNSAIMGSVPRERLGQGSGMLATMRNVGMVLGIAVSGAIFTTRRAAYLAGPAGVVAQQAYAWAVRDAFLAGAVLAMVGVLTSLVRGAPVPLTPEPAGTMMEADHSRRARGAAPHKGGE